MVVRRFAGIGTPHHYRGRAQLGGADVGSDLANLASKVAARNLAGRIHSWNWCGVRPDGGAGDRCANV